MPKRHDAPNAHHVLLVEDDDFTRSTLAAALQSHGIKVVAAVGTAREALAMKHLPEVAVIDLDLGLGPNGIDVAVALREHDPLIALVLLTSYEDPRLIDTALPTLPRGIRYLRKRDVNNVNEVVSAIHDAANSPLAIQRLEALALTEPQLEILRGVAEGLSTAEIARRRGVTDKAVEGIITRLCEHFDLPPTVTVSSTRPVRPLITDTEFEPVLVT
ncbi:MAG: response regulator [Candidatus Nanopelagicales bacterium]